MASQPPLLVGWPPPQPEHHVPKCLHSLAGAEIQENSESRLGRFFKNHNLTNSEFWIRAPVNQRDCDHTVGNTRWQDCKTVRPEPIDDTSGLIQTTAENINTITNLEAAGLFFLWL